MQEEEKEKKAEIVEEETPQQIDDARDDKTELPADLSKEFEEQEKLADNNKVETQQTDANTESEVRYSAQEKAIVSEDKDEIVDFRNRLYAYLEAQIPNPDLNSIDLNNILSKVDYKGYKDLYILALDGIEKRINQKNYLIQEERKKLINDIYRQMVNELNKRYRENTNLINYKSADNEYGHIYKDIVENYDAAIKSLEEHRKEKELFLTEQFNINKKQYVEREAKRAEEEYDKINKPIIKQEIREFIDDIRAQADKEKQLQLEKLEDDIYLDVSGRNDELMDNLIKDYMPSIDSLITTISNDFQNHVTEILNKTEIAVVKLIDQVQDVEKKRVEAASLSEEKIDAEVARKTVDYSHLKQQVSELEQLIFDKKKEAGNYQEELLKKDAQLQSAAEERKALADDREYHKLRADNASRELNELRELQIKAMQETANNPYVTVRATTIEKKRNNGEKLTLSEKLEGIDRKIYNMIGAALIAASLLGSAAILGDNDDNQNEIKSLEQQVKAQQEQINEAKSVEEATTEAPTTEEPKTEAPKSKESSKSAETKSR
ncbi:hypothetical protein ERX40_10105 [Macrococcus carouselicus]|uniref:Uncharacterized protein n=2 Tax=Macrococcus carouselicus TaxID=69969 RepID=A0A9Q8CCX0_9STAP|nr:hypothetical protein ERX40_10105 [Macrococcus carouselicus]